MPRERDQKQPKRRAPARDEAPREPRAGTVALLGRPNVGKSTMLNALLGERIAITSPHPQTTRDRIAGILTRDAVQFVFLDTPGFHDARSELGARMNKLAGSAAADCDVAVFVTDVDLPPGAQAPRASLRDADRAILAAIPASTPAVLVVNKIDRVKPRSALLPVLEGYAKERDFAAIVPVSALRADGVDRLLAEVAALLPAGDLLHDPDEISDKPVRFFVAEFVREQILHRTRQEVPHGVAVTVDSFDEGPKVVRIAVTVHVAKDSHKGILIGDGGKMLASIGRAARERAEELLGRKVHLETWVRATPRWFDDPARLADLGYDEGAAPRPKRSPRTSAKKQPRAKERAQPRPKP